MKLNAVSGSLILSSLAGSALAGHGGVYLLSEQIVGEDFYNSFNFENITDPTHGRVYAYAACMQTVLLLID